MANPKKLNVIEIIMNSTFILKDNDIYRICENDDVALEIVSAFKAGAKLDGIRKLLLKYSDYLNANNLLTVLLRNVIEFCDEKDKKIRTNNQVLAGLEKRLERLKKDMDLIESVEIVKQIDKLKKEINEDTKAFNSAKSGLVELKEMAGGLDAIVPYYCYNTHEQRYEVNTLSLREIVEERIIVNEENEKRFNEVAAFFGEGEDVNGMRYVIQPINLEDLSYIFPSRRFGELVKTMIIENTAMKRGVTSDEINRLRYGDIEEYRKRVENYKWDIRFNSYIADVLKAYAQYIDVDSLLLLSAFRFNESLEEEMISPSAFEDVQTLIEGILKCIKDKKTKLYFERNFEEDGDRRITRYCIDDVNDCLKRFRDGTYITKKQAIDFRQKMREEGTNLSQIDPEILDIVFSEEDLEEFAFLSGENLIFVAQRQNWDADKVVDSLKRNNNYSRETLMQLFEISNIGLTDLKQLYIDGFIEFEVFNNAKKEHRSSEFVSSDELLDYYNNTTQKGLTEQERKVEEDKLSRYTRLYKQLLEEAGEEQKEQYEEELITLISEGENSKSAAEYLYIQGILRLETIYDWYGEEFINELYSKGVVTLDDLTIITKTKKVSFEFLSNKYIDLVRNKDIEYEERLRYIRSGFISQYEIQNLFQRSLLSAADLIKLASEGFIEERLAKTVIENTTLEQLEANSPVRLVGANKLKKIDNNIYADDNDKDIQLPTSIMPYRKPKEIIDPDFRENYILLFGAILAETDTELDEDCPFYNYEFYIIPDETGKKGPNSVVIAERYYEDKNTEKRFATNNATYFFRYGDFMVLNNMPKSEMDKERENIVFKANHVMASENRVGSWAASVAYCVVKTMLSSDLKDESKKNQREIIVDKLIQVFGIDGTNRILEMGIEIDSGMHNAEILESGTCRKSSKPRAKKEKNNKSGIEH